jgi:hypothetical protein
LLPTGFQNREPLQSPTWLDVLLLVATTDIDLKKFIKVNHPEEVHDNL